ncbi:hypothetical protein LAG90_06460 [Marinilongibacter aquaticus]|uniref:hypothetical protein n=1 Tax=Marinilongibacter aquaticus TaxID=2975157 RepID=UPI0021BDACA0|nr:hypothetical protein [Marinilongibacter aquaticus]UBM60284.1 hypothetical protein LAG90_06460 [Marinilongibacter aquaticus]
MKRRLIYLSAILILSQGAFSSCASTGTSTHSRVGKRKKNGQFKKKKKLFGKNDCGCPKF